MKELSISEWKSKFGELLQVPTYMYKRGIIRLTYCNGDVINRSPILGPTVIGYRALDGSLVSANYVKKKGKIKGNFIQGKIHRRDGPVCYAIA